MLNVIIRCCVIQTGIDIDLFESRYHGVHRIDYAPGGCSQAVHFACMMTALSTIVWYDGRTTKRGEYSRWRSRPVAVGYHSTTTTLGEIPSAFADSKEPFCMLNHQRELTLSHPTAASTAAGYARPFVSEALETRQRAVSTRSHRMFCAVFQDTEDACACPRSRCSVPRPAVLARGLAAPVTSRRLAPGGYGYPVPPPVSRAAPVPRPRFPGGRAVAGLAQGSVPGGRRRAWSSAPAAYVVVPPRPRLPACVSPFRAWSALGVLLLRATHGPPPAAHKTRAALNYQLG